MKISTLLKREPFGEIFEKTLKSFLDYNHNSKYNVKWNLKHSHIVKSNSQQLWYCNPYINSIYVSNVNLDVFNSINGEYYYNPLKPWKSFFQRIYLFISQSKMFRILMSKYIINISPGIHNACNKLIIGGNNKIRLIDIDKQKVYVILKYGFEKKYIINERYVRDNFNYISVPKIIDNGKNDLWFSEEYISGTPINRLKRDIKNKVLTDAISEIHKLLNETKRDLLLSEYIDILNHRIETGISNLSKEDKNNTKNIKKIIFKFLNKSKDRRILLAYTHGDFHMGNIFSNKHKYCIIDWENSGERHIGYDLFILLYGSRIDKGYSERFTELFNSKLNSKEKEIVINWPGMNFSKIDEFRCDLMLFLIEDLIFHINEKNNVSFYNNANNIKIHMKEIKKILNNIEIDLL